MDGAHTCVIFDIGNVLIRWDARLVFRDFLPDAAALEAFLEQIDFHGWNLDFDRGRDWTEGVTDMVARHPQHEAAIRAFDSRWHETLPGEVEGARAVLDELKAAGVPLYAITNYSGRRWAETLPRFPWLAETFRDVVVSGHEGIVKPDPAIFRRCLKRNGLAAERCVFIDDSAANVAAAASLGIDAIRFTDTAALRAALVSRGLLPAGSA
jgi:2-haloacid dehalogenase